MDLYLASTEFTTFDFVRKILKYRHIVLEGQEFLEVETDIPILGQSLGFGDYDPNKFFLLNRYNNGSLHKLYHFPIEVIVYTIKSRNVPNPSNVEDIQLLAWATLYDSFKDAKKRKRSYF